MTDILLSTMTKLHSRVWNRHVIMTLFTGILFLVFFLYTVLYSRHTSVAGVTVPLVLYILFTTLFYNWRWGSLIAILVWAIVIFWFSNPSYSGLWVIILSFIWAEVIVLFGVLFRRVLEQKEQEIYKRDIYSSMAAHEMKTPIAVLRIRSAMLKKKDPELAAIIDKELYRIEGLIDGMMDYSKLRSGQFELSYSSFSLQDVVNEVVDRIAILHPETQLVKQFPKVKILLAADKRAVEQIVNNLLVNAVKYGKERRITISLKRQRRKWIQIQVKDGGDGIPIQYHQSLFKPFSQVNRSSQGLGIGLYIVYQFVTLHGGKIWFRTGKKGTSFIVELPLKKPLTNIPNPVIT